MLLIVLLAKLLVVVALTEDILYYNYDEDSYTYYDPIFVGECGGNFTASRNPQNFSTPFYPEKYYNNMVCVWNIRASSANERIFLIFHDFETENHFDVMEVSTAITCN